MQRYDKYLIEYKKLGIGKHHLHYDIADNFFEEFEFTEFKKFNLKVDIETEIRQSVVLANMTITGKINMQCDLCGEYYDQKIKNNIFLTFKISDKTANEETFDEVIYIHTNDDTIDIKKILYDYIILSVPVKHHHPYDKDGNPSCGIDYKETSQIQEKKTFKDLANWDKIKNIFNN